MFALIFGPFQNKVSSTHIWSLMWLSLHSYLVPFRIKFAFIFGPYCDQVCSLIWSLLLWSLHSYLVPIIIMFALIIVPLRYSLSRYSEVFSLSMGWSLGKTFLGKFYWEELCVFQIIFSQMFPSALPPTIDVSRTKKLIKHFKLVQPLLKIIQDGQSNFFRNYLP